MVVNSFCREFLLQYPAALHGEFLLVLHTLCWFMRGAPQSCVPPCWFCNYMGSFFYMPSAGLYGSFSYMTSAGLSVEFFLHTTCWLLSVGNFSHNVYAGFLMLGISSLQNKKKKCKSDLFILHNWVMLLSFSCRHPMQAPQGCIMSSSWQCWNKYKHEMDTC